MTPEETLAQWNQQLDPVRARMSGGGGKPGLASPAMLKGKTRPRDHAGHAGRELPYRTSPRRWTALVEVDKGKAVFQGTPQLAHYNPLGSVHGGWYATLLDSALVARYTP